MRHKVWTLPSRELFCLPTAFLYLESGPIRQLCALASVQLVVFVPGRSQHHITAQHTTWRKVEMTQKSPALPYRLGKARQDTLLSWHWTSDTPMQPFLSHHMLCDTLLFSSPAVVDIFDSGSVILWSFADQNWWRPTPIEGRKTGGENS